jgi:hypothetical protein
LIQNCQNVGDVSRGFDKRFFIHCYGYPFGFFQGHLRGAAGNNYEDCDEQTGAFKKKGGFLHCDHFHFNYEGVKLSLWILTTLVFYVKKRCGQDDHYQKK